jgi:dTDP-4-amino-4,6-dideoxygalactose transaminase
VALGFNYRMTDMQGALGVSQMTRLKQFVARRHELASRYNELLKDLPLTTPWQDPDGYSGLHLYVIRLHLDQIKKTHLEVFEGLRANGIIVNLHYIPVHLQPYYQRLGFKVGQFPEAERFYAEAISLPMYATLSEEQQNKVVGAISQVIL